MRRAEWLAGLCLLGCGGGDAPRAEATPPPAQTRARDLGLSASVTLTPEAAARLGIAVAPVERRSVPQMRELPGEVQARPGGVVTIAAPVPGLLVAAGELPRPGAVVTQGQALARLVPLASVDRDLRARAQSQVAAAEARRVASESRAQRAERLITGGAGSERSAEEARAERDIAAAELVAAKARLRMIERAPLASDVATVLRAPFAAVVRQVFVADGQSVGGGASLVELVADSPLWVRVPVPSADLADLAEAPARIAALAGTDAPVLAAPVAGPPTADPGAGTVDRYFELPAGAFRLGERVAVTLAERGSAEAPVIPWSAVVHDASGQAWVYVQVGEHAYERRRVELLRIHGELAVLSRGPAPGALVVTAGAVELYGAEFEVGH